MHQQQLPAWDFGFFSDAGDWAYAVDGSHWYRFNQGLDLSVQQNNRNADSFALHPSLPVTYLFYYGFSSGSAVKIVQVGRLVR